MARTARTKLTAEQRKTMLGLFGGGTHTKKELADNFGCSVSTVSNIVNPTKAKSRITTPSRSASNLSAGGEDILIPVAAIVSYKGVPCVRLSQLTGFCQMP